MIMVITVTLLAAYALTTLVIYRQNVGLMERETRQEADYIVKAIEISGTDYLKQMDEVEKNTRITLIDPAGDVLYDSTEDAVTLQNHKNRPEIKAAHKNHDDEQGNVLLCKASSGWKCTSCIQDYEHSASHSNFNPADYGIDRSCGSCICISAFQTAGGKADSTN